MKSTSLFLIGFISAFSLGSLGAADTNVVAPIAPPAIAATGPVVEPIPLIRVLSNAEAVAEKMRTVEADLASDPVADQVAQKLGTFGSHVEAFHKESSRILESTPSLDRIRWLQEAWTFVANYLNQWRDDLGDREKELSDYLAETEQLRQVWEATRQNAVESSAPPEVTERAGKVVALLDVTRSHVQAKREKIAALASRMVDLDARIVEMRAAVEQGRKRAISLLFVENIPPAWSSEWLSKTLLSHSGESRASQWATLRAYIIWQQSRFLEHGIILVALVAFFIWLRRKVRSRAANDPELHRASEIFDRPIATAFLLALIASNMIYPMAPRLLTTVLGAMLLLPAIVVVRKLVQPRLFPILDALVIFYFIDQLRSLFLSLIPLSRILFLTETLATITFILWLLRSDRLQSGSTMSKRMENVVRLLLAGAMLILGVAVGSNLLGYGQLGNLLRNGVMRSAYVGVMLYGATQVVSALLLIISHMSWAQKIGAIKNAGPILLGRISWFIGLVGVILWGSYTLEMFSIRAAVVNWTVTLFTTPYDKDHPITLWNVTALGLIIWGAFLISRFVRFILDEDVYPRLRLAHGVPYAISTMVHYAILLVAFLAAATILGISMTNVTILVSALGVGVGFGLQNIINNFVSGLILLFERPIKVGDSIQIGDAVGVVQRIGIRSSVLLTTSGSEVIIPNGSLTSDRITNWTLSHRRRIIVVPVNIARGPAPEHVMEILRQVATAHPLVAQDPAPQVLITNLGATLNFELRAWTSKVEQWTQVRSDLSLAINSALAAQNIAIS